MMTRKSVKRHLVGRKIIDVNFLDTDSNGEVLVAGGVDDYLVKSIRLDSGCVLLLVDSDGTPGVAIDLLK